MSRRQHRAERFRKLQDLNPDPVALAREDLRTLDSWEFDPDPETRLFQEIAHGSQTPQLKWVTPDWAKPERYQMVNFDNGDQFIVRPVGPSLNPPIFECVRNAVVVQVVTGDVYKACIWMERNLL